MSNAESVWGDVLPGTVFWQDVTTPANQALLDDDSNEPLPESEVKALRAKLEIYTDALQRYEHTIYPKKIAYLKQKIRDAHDKKQEVKYKRQLKKMLEYPPAPPKRPGLLERLFKRKETLVIFNEKQAQALRLRIARIEAALEQHAAALQNKLLYDQLAKEMQLEVAYFGKQLIKRWSALQNREEYYVNGKRHVRLVRIAEAHYTPDSIQFKILASSRSLLGAVQHHLPDNVSAWDLVKPETLSELSVACERPVGTPHEENTPESFANGCWVTVYREGLTDGLFDFIEYEKVILKYNDLKRAKFGVPVGVSSGRVVKWFYLTEQPHIMVNGLTGSGKTNALRIMLTTWVANHSPEDIRFYIADLKRGGDFRHFVDVPHLASPVIKDIGDVVNLSGSMVTLMYQRMNLFSETNTLDIEDYNRHVSKEHMMPHIVVMIDECSAINYVAASKADTDMIWRNMTVVATQARAAGIHLVLGTQQSFKDAIPPGVRDNITLVLSGRQRTLAASLATLGTGRAKKIASIRGRMLCDDGSSEPFLIQTPYVSKEAIESAVATAMNYGDRSPLVLPAVDPESVPVNQITPQNVIRLAITEHGGSLSVRPLFETLQDFASRRQVEGIVKQIAKNETVEFEGAEYLVAKEGSGYRLKLMAMQSEAV